MTYDEFLNSKFSQGLNAGQLSFFREFLTSRRNIFLTGGAGVGKSFVVSRLSELCESEGIVLNKTASTGVAALNISAQTLHSFLGIGLGDGTREELFSRVKSNKKALKRLQGAKLILIDEISMISGELFDKFYAIIKKFCRSTPRVVICGDALQLPPVFRDEDEVFFFETDGWVSLNPKTILLTEICRQKDGSDYAIALSKIRQGDRSAVSLFDQCLTTKFPEDHLVVFSKNVDVDNFNLAALRKISSKSNFYYAADSGNPNLIRSLDKLCLAPMDLELKVGCRVMMLRNDLEKGISNGSLGTVKALHSDSVTVAFDGCGVHDIFKAVWKIEEPYLLDGKVKMRTLAKREQIPLRLAYASTVHKMQGMTCDKVAMDLSSCFAPGQVYVALSRARSLDGLKIIGLDPSLIITNDRCLEFYKDLEHL